MVHAEVNAIMHKTCIDLKACTIYVTHFPCNECAKVIVQAGIKVIYYLKPLKDNPDDDRLYTKASQELLKRVGYDIIKTNSTDKPKEGAK